MQKELFFVLKLSSKAAVYSLNEHLRTTLGAQRAFLQRSQYKKIDASHTTKKRRAIAGTPMTD